MARPDLLRLETDRRERRKRLHVADAAVAIGMRVTPAFRRTVAEANRALATFDSYAESGTRQRDLAHYVERIRGDVRKAENVCRRLRRVRAFAGIDDHEIGAKLAEVRRACDAILRDVRTELPESLQWLLNDPEAPSAMLTNAEARASLGARLGALFQAYASAEHANQTPQWYRRALERFVKVAFLAVGLTFPDDRSGVERLLPKTVRTHR